MADVDSTAITNTITTSETNESLDVELIESYTQELSRLTDVLGIVSPSVVSAGTALFTYEVTGNLDTTEVAEGAEVPLSQYETAGAFRAMLMDGGEVPDCFTAPGITSAELKKLATVDRGLPRTYARWGVYTRLESVCAIASLIRPI